MSTFNLLTFNQIHVVPKYIFDVSAVTEMTLTFHCPAWAMGMIEVNAWFPTTSYCSQCDTVSLLGKTVSKQVNMSVQTSIAKTSEEVCIVAENVSPSSQYALTADESRSSASRHHISPHA